MSSVLVVLVLVVYHSCTINTFSIFKDTCKIESFVTWYVHLICLAAKMFLFGKMKFLKITEDLFCVLTFVLSTRRVKWRTGNKE